MARRSSFLSILGTLALVLAFGFILKRLGLGGLAPVSGTVGFVSSFAIGIVASLSSCAAVSGGLLIGASAKYNERLPADASRARRLFPSLMFAIGRVASYAMLGGAIGFLGKGLELSPVAYGAIIMAAALVMVFLGLDMLKLLPHWAKALMPRMPASLGRRIMGAESSPKPYAPALLGASTFFLPCAFTATMQIYALGVGSFAGGAAVLGGFALGTVPGLLALGWASAAGRGGFGRFFFRFAGTAIVVLGFVGIGNGLAVMGVTYTPPGGDRLTAAAVAMDDGQAQTVSMKVNPDSYEPSNLTIKAGLKTIWKIDATEAAGCIRSLVSRQLGIKKLLDQGENTVEFTAPSVPGTYGFSCSMGMYRGTFTVVN